MHFIQNDIRTLPCRSKYINQLQLIFQYFFDKPETNKKKNIKIT